MQADFLKIYAIFFIKIKNVNPGPHHFFSFTKRAHPLTFTRFPVSRGGVRSSGRRRTPPHDGQESGIKAESADATLTSKPFGNRDAQRQSARPLVVSRAGLPSPQQVGFSPHFLLF